MGITITASSVWAILKRHGIESPPRRSGLTWGEFLHSQPKAIVACDLFSVDRVLLRRLYVLVFIHHDTRLVRIAGVTTKPVADWVTQRARNLSMELAEQASTVKFLISDRDTKFTAEGAGIIKTPIRAPRANAVCERVIGTLGVSASTGCSFSAVVTWSPYLPSTPSTTTRIATGLSAAVRRLHATRPLAPSATLISPGSERSIA